MITWQTLTKCKYLTNCDINGNVFYFEQKHSIKERLILVNK